MDSTHIAPPPRENGGVGDLLRGIVDDVKTIAKDEAALTRIEVGKSLKSGAADAGAIVLAGIVALIGLGLLCVAAVVALDAVIASLAIRLVIMAAIYMVVGGAVAATFVKKLKGDLMPDLTIPTHEAKATIANAREALRHA